MSRPLRNASSLSVLFAAALSAGAAPPMPTLGPDALRPGQRAVVKTVFEGGLVEDFDAEIVAVMKGGRAEGDLILAKATSERVIRSGVAQGMSGSPVYVDGKFEPRLRLPLSLSYDHRLIDGADAARFLRWVVGALEQPFQMLLEG